jgi:hypothetical protein
MSSLHVGGPLLQQGRTPVELRLVVVDRSELGTRLGVCLALGLALASGRVQGTRLGAVLAAQRPALERLIRVHEAKSTPIRAPQPFVLRGV